MVDWEDEHTEAPSWAELRAQWVTVVILVLAILLIAALGQTYAPPQPDPIAPPITAHRTSGSGRS